MTQPARYPIRFESNAKEIAGEGASALEQFRQKIESTQANIKGYQNALRSLKGSTEEVKKAKEALQDKLKAEQTAMTSATLATLKAGTTYEKLTEQSKKASAESKKLADYQKKLGEDQKTAIASMIPGFNSLKTVLGESSSGAAVLALGVTAAVTAVAALAAGIGFLGTKLAGFILENANILRTQQLTREAFVGNEEDARHLGNQIDALARKLPTARAELNNMANDLVLAGIQGQTLVDTLNAVGQTSAAIGGTAANQLRGFIERGRLTQRFFLSPLELRGTGLAFQDVVKQIATQTGSSVDQAATALIQGQVSLGDGAAALRTVVEKRFGKTNLLKMLDLDVLKQKFTETVQSLTKDVNLDPLLNAVKELFSLFDTATETGTDLKELITFLGQGAVDSFAKGTPALKVFVESLVGYALDLESEYLTLKLQFQDTFGDDVIGNLSIFSAALIPIKAQIDGLVSVMSGLATTSEAAFSAIRGIKNLDVGSVGKDAAKGLILGVGGTDVGASLGKNVLSGLKTALGIASPSKVLEKEIGEPSGEGISRGMTKSVGVDNAARAIVPSGGAGGGEAASPQITIGPFTFHYQGDAKRADLDDFQSKVRAEIVQVLELALRQRGLSPVTR